MKNKIIVLWDWDLKLWRIKAGYWPNWGDWKKEQAIFDYWIIGPLEIRRLRDFK